MKFTVEVPVYLRLDIEALDADDAAAKANHYVEVVRQGSQPRVLTMHGDDLRAEMVLPDEEDRAPDVYICRGGQLALVNEEGFLEPLDEAC